MESLDNLASSFVEDYPVRILRPLVGLMDNILTEFFSGYFMIESEPLNTQYVRLAHRATELADKYPEVSEALADALSVFPNLYESVGDPDSPDERWESGQEVVRRLRARVSTLYATTVSIEQELSEHSRQVLQDEALRRGESFDDTVEALQQEAIQRGDSVAAAAQKDTALIRATNDILKTYADGKRQKEKRWEEQVDKAGQIFQQKAESALSDIPDFPSVTYNYGTIVGKCSGILPLSLPA